MIPTVSCMSLPSFRVPVMLFVFIASVSGPPARAEVALYEANVVWSDQDAADRASAFRRALRRYSSSSRACVGSRIRHRSSRWSRMHKGSCSSTSAHGDGGARRDECAGAAIVGSIRRGRRRPTRAGGRVAGVEQDSPIGIGMGRGRDDGTMLAVGSEGSERVAEILSAVRHREGCRWSCRYWISKIWRRPDHLNLGWRRKSGSGPLPSAISREAS